MESCLPQAFVERIHRLFSEDYNDVLQSFEKKRHISIRINTLKASIFQVKEYLKGHNIPYLPVQGMDEALRILHLSAREITEWSIYKEGHIYIQSLSSMIPVEILDPISREKVLDMAAAPGSKTTQIAARMKNSGSIVANDIDRTRLYKLKAISRQLGVENVQIMSMPGQVLWKKFPEYFDKVLLDAPCSMEGRFDCTEKSTYEHWSLRKVKNMARLQRWLLRSAFSATKIGGIVVYSTCTLSPEENEGVVDWLLQKQKGAVVVEPVSIPNILTIEGLQSFEKESYSSDIRKTTRIIPSELFEGFYIAKLRKIKSTLPSGVDELL